MSAQNKTIALTLSLLLLGGVYVADYLGFWVTESTKEPVKYTDGEFAGSYNPADIRGSYSFGDVANAFDISVGTLADAYGIDATDYAAAEFKLNELEIVYPNLGEDVELGTGSVKYFVALYTGLPYEDEGDGLPLRGVDILTEEGKIDDAKRNELLAIAIDLSLYQTSDEASSPTTETSENEVEEEKIITGNTTIQDLYNFGLTDDILTEVLGEIPATKSMSLRDFCTEKGLSFSEIKATLIERIDH
jgi:hypothetical protein